MVGEMESAVAALRNERHALRAGDEAEFDESLTEFEKAAAEFDRIAMELGITRCVEEDD